MDTVFASKSAGTVIDFVRDGLTDINRKTLEQIRADFPDAEVMSLDDWCAWKASTQGTPITWEETPEERYREMLECLPPAVWTRSGFLVGEPWDHDALTGQPRYQAFRQVGDRFIVASRPMTVKEFRALA